MLLLWLGAPAVSDVFGNVDTTYLFCTDVTGTFFSMAPLEQRIGEISWHMLFMLS